MRISPHYSHENRTTFIIDSSPKPENKDQLETEIKRADVILIVYSVDRTDTFTRISDFWLPYLKRLGKNVPVILVGNKMDLSNTPDSNDLAVQMAPVLKEFKVIMYTFI